MLEMGNGSSSGTAASSSGGSPGTGEPSPDEGKLIGEIAAGHKLYRLLAVGGMGEVYLGKHQTLGVTRAIKVIRTNHRGGDKWLERFNREARILARLQHNNIVQIIEFGSLANGRPFLAMEYIDGPTLEDMVQHGSLQVASALIVLEQMALALHHAHSNSVIHRDLKPSNILVRAGDVRQVKIIDFGLARILDSEGERLTGDDMMIGSRAYMAPEQAEGAHDVTPASDVYALAAIAYEIVSGTPPFVHKKAVRLMAAHVNDVPPKLSERCPEIPAVVDELLYRCLAKDPAKRPTADEIARTLGTHMRGTPPEMPAASSRPKADRAERLARAISRRSCSISPYHAIPTGRGWRS
jgi:serine/threonine protein kinase